MTRISIKNQVAWYASHEHIYKSLAEIIAATLKALLKHNKIDYVDIPHRAKAVDSFQEKIRRKKYKDPKSEMTDLAGIRVIAYIEADVAQVSKLIQSSFNVHADSSVDKTTDLGEDRFGYRSVHYVCDIGQNRETLPEFSPYKGLLFEIQVRTALQHTWAEIEHDRSYKFSGDLPPKIKRRFHLVAGLLELADREFDELTREIDNYKIEIHRKADSGNLNIELNSTSILEFINIRLSKHQPKISVAPTAITQELIEELNLFGVRSLQDLDTILPEALINLEQKHQIKNNSFGLLRNAMMYADIRKYFEKSWRSSWTGLDERSIALLAEKHDQSVLDEIISEYDLDVYNDDDVEIEFVEPAPDNPY
jgi:putative GTP pyrophosphokinase